jgi:hypothetical protein
MKVLVIGTGNMGSGFVKQLAAAGHQVTVTARDGAKAQALATQFGAKAVAAEAAANPVFAQVLAEGAELGGQKVTVFLASDSERAKQTAHALAESMGFQTMDAGGLKNARYLEPLAGLNIYFGYGAGLGTTIAPTWIRKN